MEYRLSPFLFEHTVLSCIRRTLEGQPVPIRVRYTSDPHRIANKWLLRRDATCADLAIDRDCVAALEVDRHADTKSILRSVTMLAFLPEFLQHQCGVSELQPAPLQPAVDDPFPGLLEAKPIDVEQNRLRDISNPEKRDGLMNVDLRIESHCLFCVGYQTGRSRTQIRRSLANVSRSIFPHSPESTLQGNRAAEPSPDSRQRV
jgi:hypothetical protein